MYSIIKKNWKNKKIIDMEIKFKIIKCAFIFRK